MKPRGSKSRSCGDEHRARLRDQFAIMRSVVGVGNMVVRMIDYDYSTPHSYAARIAHWISDPSTIRLRTSEMYGRDRAPSIEECRAFREKATTKRDRRTPEMFGCGHDREPMNIIEYSDGREKCMICHKAVQDKRRAAQEADRTRRAKLAEEARIAAKRAKAAAKAAYLVPIENHAVYGDILASVAKAFGLTVAELKGEGRACLYIGARAVAIKLMRDAGASFPNIAKRLNKDCHSTIIHSYKTWGKRSAANPYLKVVYEALRK